MNMNTQARICARAHTHMVGEGGESEKTQIGYTFRTGEIHSHRFSGTQKAKN